MSTQTEQQPLVERLREGCIINPKRWSGDPGEPSPVNESATEELLMEAADEIERLRAIEAQAIEQSEYVQREWLSPSEATGLKREVERLRAELDRARGESWGTFEREVNAWQTKTFPRSTLASCLAHLRDELAEIEESPEAAEEYADALLLLMSAYRFCGAGVDLFTAARIKFDIVKQRNWGEPDERGVVKHVGSPPPAQQSQEDN